MNELGQIQQYASRREMLSKVQKYHKPSPLTQTGTKQDQHQTLVALETKDYMKLNAYQGIDNGQVQFSNVNIMPGRPRTSKGGATRYRNAKARAVSTLETTRANGGL